MFKLRATDNKKYILFPLLFEEPDKIIGLIDELNGGK